MKQLNQITQNSEIRDGNLCIRHRQVAEDTSAKLLICIPTYNEVENITPFIHAVFEQSPLDAHILIIDDNSPDGTANLVEGIIPAYPYRLHILKRPGKQGLAGAYCAGFDWGLSQNYDVFLEMDADFSHNPLYIPQMLTHIQDYDVVIGSRNIKGGGVEGWTPLRKVVSKGGSLYAQIMLGCPIKDLTGGFNLWTRNAILKIGLENIISKGYLFQVEMKYRAWRADCSVKEIPIIFTDRTRGVSKMSKRIFFEALIHVWKIRWIADGNTVFSQCIKFAITGGLGTITNLLIFFMLADKGGLPEIPVSIGCFVIAGTQNYIVNHKWSFSASTGTSPLSFKRWLLFLSASCAGLLLNLTVMKLILLTVEVPYKFIAQACGIAAGMVINFICSKFVVFRRKSC